MTKLIGSVIVGDDVRHGHTQICKVKSVEHNHGSDKPVRLRHDCGWATTHSQTEEVRHASR